MPTPVSGNNWDKISQGLRSAQLLNSQRKYNLSMVKCRQTLEFMVQDLCDKAAITTTNSNQDLSSLIDALYSSRWISKTTCEHYHKIRMLGNKAVHEGNDNAYDANQACQLLAHETVTFSKDYMGASRQRQPQRGGQQQRRPRPNEGRPAARSGSTRSRKRSPEGFPLTSTDLMRIAIVIIAVIIVFALVRLLRSGDSSPEETIPEASASIETDAEIPTTAAEAEVPTTAAPETMAETTPAPVYKTTDYLNVRSEPNTNSRRLGVLDAGVEVTYLGDYDATWAIIDYEGTQAYVSKQYLTQD